ncbi:unnamed protein product [Parnassius apollo]|uniref:(apollo) hypothetical protein n=1 Tax=Parnassius apollo TaxID=110799 RepID=A0A8S3YB20_PARAO|nr:unnamed protein product [Parnassius apollo]
MDENQIRLMLEEENSDSNYEDENDNEVEDFVEIQEDNYNSEQEDNSEHEQEDQSAEESNSQVESEDHQTYINYYLRKDRHTRWNKTPASNPVRRRARNIVTQLPGTKGGAKYLKEPSEIWRLFFTEDVNGRMAKYTNEQIKRISSQFIRERDCTETNEIELEALLGLLLFAGVRENCRLNAKDLFKTDGLLPEIFRLTMSWNRFCLLLRCLRFDDKDTRVVRASVDKLALIRELFEEIIAVFKVYYNTVIKDC